MEEVSYTIVEHLDPEGHVPGGIDSIIHGLLKYGPCGEVCLVGITSRADRVIGSWCHIEYAGRQVAFLPVARLQRSSHHGRIIRVPHSMRFIWGIFRYRAKIPVATFHAHRIETGLACRWLLGGRLIQFIHNDSNGLLGSNSDSSWKHFSWLYRCMERVVLKQASSTVLFNSSDASRVRNLSRRLIQSRTWYDSSIFTFKSSSALLSREGDQIALAWVGRFESQKDPLFAIRVASALRDEGFGVLLKMVGSGSLLADMRRLISDLNLESHVILTGPLGRSEVARVMGESHVVLMTSHYEGSPVVLAEANAVGAPVVATSESDPDVAIKDGINGYRIYGRRTNMFTQAVHEARVLPRHVCARSAQDRSGKVAVGRLWSQLTIPSD